jgi:hypothetical protein
MMPNTRPTTADTAKAITIDQTEIGMANWSVKNWTLSGSETPARCR